MHGCGYGYLEHIANRSYKLNTSLSPLQEHHREQGYDMDITPLNVQYEDVQDKEAPPSAGLAPEVTLTESSPMASEARVLGRDSPDAVRCTMTQ